MTGTASDPSVTASVKRVIDSLVAERQRLRREATDPALLDANRRALTYWQNELVRLGAVARPR
jgi:hypothetical protein